jgi:hypothetical protein
MVVATELAAVLALLQGERSLEDAIRSRDFAVVGAVAELRRAERGVQIALHGLARARRGPELLEQLVATVRRRQRESSHPGW